MKYLVLLLLLVSCGGRDIVHLNKFDIAECGVLTITPELNFVVLDIDDYHYKLGFFIDPKFYKDPKHITWVSRLQYEEVMSKTICPGK